MLEDLLATYAERHQRSAIPGNGVALYLAIPDYERAIPIHSQCGIRII
jgi:hypothetical protein